MIFRFLYNVLSIAALPLIVVYLIGAYRMRFFKYVFYGFGERLGRIPAQVSADCAQHPVIWIHAASVGELLMMKPLIRELRSQFLDHRILISTVTPEASDCARQLRLSDHVIFAPLDFLFSARASIHAIKPALLLLAESEFWINFIAESKKAGAVVGVVNARISDGAYQWMKVLRLWYRHVFACIDFFGARSPEDLERLTTLGVEKSRAVCTGNIKFDAVNVAPVHPDTRDALLQRFGMRPDDIIIVCGSVHPGEISSLCDCFNEVKTRFPSAKMIIAPRHVEKSMGALRTIRSRGISCRLLKSEEKDMDVTGAACVILNTIGELVDAYRIATLVFIGGSLVKKGGQNVIEPALLEKPIFFGPHMYNFKESVDALMRCGGAVRVADAQELSRSMVEVLNSAPLRSSMARRGHAAIVGLRGALAATMRLIKNYYTVTQRK